MFAMPGGLRDILGEVDSPDSSSSSDVKDTAGAFDGGSIQLALVHHGENVVMLEAMMLAVCFKMREHGNY
jgi:hypothetical protein